MDNHAVLSLFRDSVLRYAIRCIRKGYDSNETGYESDAHRGYHPKSNIQESPERAVRNLVDLGLEFSNGRFQKQFLKTARRMLHNENSAYYSLVRNVISIVDLDILTTFGVNLGYNGCTKGAKRIREIEAEQGFNIPWSLSLSLNEEKLTADPSFYPDLLRQGVSLDIYTYILFTIGNPEKVISLIQREPDCAFIFFLRGSGW